MSTQALSRIQWLGLLAAPLMWAAQHVVGFGVGVAACSAGGQRWHLDYDVWQYVLLSLACLVFVVAESSAAVVFARTRDAEDDTEPPLGRLHFFATAALVANVLFVAAPLLDGVASVASVLCRQS